MASTTNFGWQTPDDTDLVKDGAAAIRTLGSAIDTSLVDLKGGTTGQVLSKNTNSDMDFTWVTTNDADAIQNSIVDAKGDLIAASANDTPARLAVGNNGETLVADSSTTTGLRWQGNFAAGKNKVINGDFGIWQRGTSYTIVAGNYGAADRFVYWHNGSTQGTNVVSRETFTPGSAPVAGYEGQFFQRITTTTLGTGQTVIDTWQRIEDVRTLAGQTATVSLWAKSSNSKNIFIEWAQNFGSGGSASVTTTVLNATATTSSWVRYSATVAIPSVTGKTIGSNSFVNLLIRFNSPAAGETFDIWGVQVEAGNTATAFQTATGTLAGELAACQRYYEVFAGGAAGFSMATTVVEFGIPWKVTKRGTPTLSLIDTSVAVDAYGIGGSTSTASTIVASPGLCDTGTSVRIDGFTGLTQYRTYSINQTNTWLAASSEL